MRVNCVVPFCKRTRGDRKGDPVRPDMEWLCSDHWRLVPVRRRRLYAKAKREKRYGVTGYMWPRLKCQAIDAAMVGRR